MEANRFEAGHTEKSTYHDYVLYEKYRISSVTRLTLRDAHQDIRVAQPHKYLLTVVFCGRADSAKPFIGDHH